MPATSWAFALRVAAYEAEVNHSYLSKVEKGATYVGLEIIGND
jgi:hypothetical protein